MSGLVGTLLPRAAGVVLGLCLVFGVRALGSERVNDTLAQAANDDLHVVDLGVLPRGPSTLGVSVPIELDGSGVESVRYEVDCACLQVVECPTTLESGVAAVVRLSYDVPASPGPINHFVRLRAADDPDWEYVVHLTGSVRRQESCVPSGVLVPPDTRQPFEFAVLVFGDFGVDHGGWRVWGDGMAADALSVREDPAAVSGRRCRRLLLTLRDDALERVRSSQTGYVSVYLGCGVVDSDESLAARYEVRVEALRPPPDSTTLERAALRVRPTRKEGAR